MLYERAGDGERAIDTVSRWLSFDPLNEEGYRRLMRLRFSQGDRVGALRAYANCRAVLADELQVEPEPETVALAKRIRHTAPLRSPQSQPPHTSHKQLPANLLDGPFLGRSAEFGTLIECYQRVHAGQPHLVLLQGETGIGKTRLTTEFIGWAQAQGAEVLVGRALQTGRQLPYQPIIDVLRCRLEQGHAPDDLFSDVWLAELSRLLPELSDRYPDLPIPATDEALGHNRLFEAMARLVQLWAAHRPLVLLLDDMQWADTATLDLLLYLARSLAEQPAPVLLLLNLRTGADPLPRPAVLLGDGSQTDAHSADHTRAHYFHQRRDAALRAGTCMDGAATRGGEYIAQPMDAPRTGNPSLVEMLWCPSPTGSMFRLGGSRFTWSRPSKGCSSGRLFSLRFREMVPGGWC